MKHQYISIFAAFVFCWSVAIVDSDDDGLCSIAYTHCGFGDGESAGQETMPTVWVRPTSCDDVHMLDAKRSFHKKGGGLFDVYTDQMHGATQVYCDLKTDGGRWTVIQRRMDGSVDFYRDWNDYVKGFGPLHSEFWLGLETIHQLTKDGNFELRVDMMDWDGNEAYAKYSTFVVGDAESKYKLTVSGYTGTAGGDSMAHQNGQKFTTKDSDNDPHSTNCAVLYKGAWWYNACHHSNPNGLYVADGAAEFGVAINWYHWKGHKYSLKFIEMKVRKKY